MARQTLRVPGHSEYGLTSEPVHGRGEGRSASKGRRCTHRASDWEVCERWFYIREAWVERRSHE